MEAKEERSPIATAGKVLEFLCDLKFMQSPSVLFSSPTEEKYLHFSISERHQE